MAIPTTIESLSTTAASNGPSGSDDRSTADDGLRYAYAFIRQTVSLGSNIASASTITPPSTGYAFNITGNTTITTIASTNSWDGRLVLLIFAGALTLTHSSNLALPGSANITTAANDIAEFVQTASGAWRMVNYRTATDNLTVKGQLVVNGNTAFGDATTDTSLVTGAFSVAGPTSAAAVAISASTNTGYSLQAGVSNVYWINTIAASSKLLIGGNGASIPTSAPIELTNAGNVTINAPSSGYGLNIPTGTPASAAASGTAGDIAWDSSYIYVCTAANTWKRAALSTW